MFIKSLLENTLMPSLIIVTFALSWPAGIVLAAMYIGYKLYESYKNKEKEQQQDALPELTCQADEQMEALNDSDDDEFYRECALLTT